jgi:serine/threonine protein kinase
MHKPRRCPRCGGEVSADAPEGLCPECLYQLALQGPGAGPDREEESRSPAPAFVPPAPKELARHFPHLEILELLGQGGMGAVYKARQTKLDRLVAVKVLPPEVARDPAFAERFTREARSLAHLNHPNIVTVYDFGEADGLFYFSMEYVDGQNVRQLLLADALTPARALQIVPQVCDALGYAHDEGIVHRDIKPENILLDRKGRVKIADFGLAKLVGLTPAYLTLTGAAEVMGTLYYMAPEQTRRSHLVDHRADLYSLGVVFYEMLTGELPLGRFAPPSHKAPVDARLDPIVLRALAREPENRYQDAGELKRDVETVAGGGPGFASAPRPEPAVVRPTWPSVRFVIPKTSRKGKRMRGEIYRDEQALILEYEEDGAVGDSEIKSLRIPLSDVVSLSHGWNWEKGFPELVIRTTRLSGLAGLPAGKTGRGHLRVDWHERKAAKQLVDSVMRRDLSPGQALDHERAGMELVAPAIGLLLTGLVAFLANIAILASVAPQFWDYRALFIGLVLATGVAVAVLGVGAWGMLRLHSYVMAVVATFVAMLPWSPAWLLGLPMGIWALVVLRRPEVMDAMRYGRRASRPGEPGPQVQKRRLGGRVLSLFRSMGGYFLTTRPYAAPDAPTGPGDAPPVAQGPV